jgi:hypothetical protein
MDNDKLADFLQFAKKYRQKFKQIASATKQEFAPDDVQIEAWILIEERELGEASIHLHDPQDIDRLFALLYVKLVKNAERKIRNSVRLDHYSYGDSEDEVHPLMNKLAASGDTQPLEILLAREAAIDLLNEPESHESRAAAYLYLLQYHHNKMKCVADHLLISLSYCYFRFNEAREMARTQCVLPDTIGKSSGAFFPGPWRTFRLARIERSYWRCQPWVQIELDLLPSVDFR